MSANLPIVRPSFVFGTPQRLVLVTSPRNIARQTALAARAGWTLREVTQHRDAVEDPIIAHLHLERGGTPPKREPEETK